MGVYSEIKELLQGYPSFYAMVYSACIEPWKEHEDKINSILEDDDFSFDDLCDLCHYLWNDQDGNENYTLDEIATMICKYIIKNHRIPRTLEEMI